MRSEATFVFRLLFRQSFVHLEQLSQSSVVNDKVLPILRWLQRMNKVKGYVCQQCKPFVVYSDVDGDMQNWWSSCVAASNVRKR
jgi:hypothetical protein